jgi:uncharacterized protein YbjQ (UPF0145 family)
MKKLLVLLLIPLLSSCYVQKYSESYFIADFRPYTDEGFTISPLANYASPYKSIGVISVEVIPGVDGSMAITRNGQKQGDLYSGPSVPGKWREPTPEEMLDKLVEYAKSLGANGLLDCSFQEVRVQSKAYPNRDKIAYYRWSGFAVEL